MRCVIQRVSRAEVAVDLKTIGKIDRGYLALLCVEQGDTPIDARYMIEKISGLRIFEDEQGKMNRSILDVGGAVLLVSQFTLMGDARHGRRPSFSRAARPEEAAPMMTHIEQSLRALGIEVQTGQFQAHMDVTLTNDGPVTLLLDSRKGF